MTWQSRMKQKNNLIQTLSDKEKEVTTLDKNLRELENQLKQQKMKYTEHVDEAYAKVNAPEKANKLKEKDIYNLKKKEENCIDTISKLRSSKTGLEYDVKRLNKKLKRCAPNACRVSISCQTYNEVDTPYLVTEKLPPIFGSHICVQTKPFFMSNSLPDLSNRLLIEDNEEDKILEAREKVECSVCDLKFNSSRELDEHNQFYQYCCRTCSTCYRTVQESSLCCFEESID